MEIQNQVLKPSVIALLFLGVVISFLNSSSAQSAAVLPLLISPSPRANGMGNTYTALSADDPMAIYFNPAFLGRIAEEYYFAGSFYPAKTSWLPGLVDDMSISAQAYQIGYNFQKNIQNFPSASEWATVEFFLITVHMN